MGLLLLLAPPDPAYKDDAEDEGEDHDQDGPNDHHRVEGWRDVGLRAVEVRAVIGLLVVLAISLGLARRRILNGI